METDIKSTVNPARPRADSTFGMFEVVSTAPTHVPKNYLDQIKIYVSGSTYRLYWYDHVNNVWHYVTATA